MGRFGKALATIILAASVALGTASGRAILRNERRLERDPDYVTATETRKVAGKVVEGLRDLSREDAETGQTGTYLYPGPEGVFYPFSSKNPDEEAKLPNVERAREDICKAEDYLKLIQKVVDAKKIRSELKEIEDSLPRGGDYDPKTADFSSQEKKLYGIAKDLSKTQIEYTQRAYDNNGYALKGAGAMIGLMTSLAGGGGALVKLVNEYEEKKKKGLEKKTNTTAAVLGGLGLLFSLIFFSSKLTGYSVANIPLSSTGLLGTLSFIIGIVGLLIHFKRK